MGVDPVVAADRALNDLVELCAQLAVLISDEIVPLPPSVLMRMTAVVAGMEASLFALVHWVDVVAAESKAPATGLRPAPLRPAPRRARGQGFQ